MAMTQQSTAETCPICGDKYIKSSKELESKPVIRYECERCGVFEIDRVLVGLGDKPWSEVKHLVSAWIRRQNKVGVTPIIADGWSIAEISSREKWEKEFQVGFPMSLNEKLNALILAYSEMAGIDYQKRISPAPPSMIAEIAAQNMAEVNGLTSLLVELGYIRGIPAYGNVISANGWMRVEELRKLIVESNSAFIAMWFSERTEKYRESVIAAVEFCGYRSVIVDQQEYNGFIMDQVISFVRQARFVVADFTCEPEIEGDGKIKRGVRGGVYWEAGMAYGLGRPVIHTCEDDLESRKRIHFDVDQYNRIFWKNDELGTEIRPFDEIKTNPNFAEKLAVRITMTVGKGNYVKPQ